MIGVAGYQASKGLRRTFLDDSKVGQMIRATRRALVGYLNRRNDTMATELEALPGEVAERHLPAGGWEVGNPVRAS